MTAPVAVATPRRPRTWLTTAMVAVCVLVWIAEYLRPEVFYRIALSPAAGRVEPWRIITSAFAHDPSGTTHIGLNMLALWGIGHMFERSLGTTRFAAVYLVAALGGSLGVIAFTPSDPQHWYVGTVGASGAIFGLFGAELAMRRMMGAPSQGLLGLLLVNAAIPFVVPNISWQGHLGGFATGLALGWILMKDFNQRRHGRPGRFWWYLAALSVLMIAAITLRYALV